MSRTDDQRLRNIVDSIDSIDSIDAVGRADALLRAHPQDIEVEKVAPDAIHFRVFTTGEAVKTLSSGLRDAHPEVPWSDIVRMRDLIGHRYYKLDPYGHESHGQSSAGVQNNIKHRGRCSGR